MQSCLKNKSKKRTCVEGVCQGQSPSLISVSPIALFREVHAHVCAISVDGPHDTHTLVRHRAPLVPGTDEGGREGGREGRAEEGKNECEKSCATLQQND